jgi:hypothetical protein
MAGNAGDPGNRLTITGHMDRAEEIIARIDSPDNGNMLVADAAGAATIAIAHMLIAIGRMTGRQRL